MMKKKKVTIRKGKKCFLNWQFAQLVISEEHSY